MDITSALGQMLEHARHTAPGLKVPISLPKLSFDETPAGSAGYFNVDESGYASITINWKFSTDIKVACAILAHELIHYILENSGIREQDRLINEKLADICIFVLGLGEVYLRGCRHMPTYPNQDQGSKIGYLEEADYVSLEIYIKQLWEDRKPSISSAIEQE